MKKRIYAVYDRITQDTVGPLWLHAHDAAAIRMFSDVAQLPNSQIAAHPADFVLVKLGEMEITETGYPSVNAQTETIITGSQWIASQQQTEER